MESPTPPLHFLAVFNRNTNTYWEPITFEEGYRQKDSYDPPLYFTAEGIQLIINELEDIELPPLVIAISNETLSKASFEGDIFSRDSEIYANFFPDDFAQGEGPNSVMPIRQFSHIKDKTIYYPQGPFPIIMIGFEDLITRYEEDKTQGYSLYQFWDSSIWHRYVYFPTRNPQLGRQNLTRILRKISSYHQKKLYQTAVAQEFLEFQCRKLANSFIIDLLPQSSGDWGHSDFIHPFHFHSETVMEHKVEEELLEKVKGYTWSALVIDDYFKAPLRSPGEEKVFAQNGENPHERSKIGIIDELINAEYPLLEFVNKNEKDPEKCYLSEAKEWLKKYPHTDILLLDYFFGIFPLEGAEKYGTEFIDEILDGQTLDIYKPFDKFWIFAISVFDHSFDNRLRVKGYNAVNEKIVWSNGADPVNTPGLFKYLLLGFLNTQKNSEGLNLTAFANEIHQRLQSESHPIENLQKLMVDTYPKAIELYTNFNSLLKLVGRSNEIQAIQQGALEQIDHTQVSIFATTYFYQLSLQRPALLEQLITLNDTLQQLWYTLSYGAGQEAPKMLMDARRTKSIIDQLITVDNQAFDPKFIEMQGLFFEKVFKYIEKII